MGLPVSTAATVSNKTQATVNAASVRANMDSAALQEFSQVPKAPPLNPFVISITNADTSNQEDAILWNPDTIITGLSTGGDTTISTTAGPTYANLIKTLAYAPLFIVNFQYSVSVKTQFANNFTHYRGNIDNTVTQDSISSRIALQRKPSYQDDKLLNVNYRTVISAFVAWQILITLNSTQQLIMTPAYQFRVD